MLLPSVCPSVEFVVLVPPNSALKRVKGEGEGIEGSECKRGEEGEVRERMRREGREGREGKLGRV
jgi:hypothetical protein